jgi:hypothetical protein
MKREGKVGIDEGIGLFVGLGDFLYYHLSALYIEEENSLSFAENENELLFTRI